MNCSWCHKPVEMFPVVVDGKHYHQRCASLIECCRLTKLALDNLEAKERTRDPDCDPMGSAEAQRLLLEYRRLNRLALAKLDTGNRLRLMFGQPLLD